MADGCNLYFTERDIDKVEKSLEKGRLIDEVRTASNILKGRINNNVDDFKNILVSNDDNRHGIVQELLVKSLSNGKLIKEDEMKLSNALHTVLQFQSSIQGLFENPPKHRGPGADSMKHGGELLTTAALIQKEKIKTLNGNTLSIDKNHDTIAFGQKFPSKHTMSTQKRNTIEADTLIAKGRGLFRGYDLIAIDTKYSKTSTTYGVKNAKEFYRQLDGIRNNFLDGNLQEFYFVSNVKFSTGFINAVNDYNIRIFKDRLDNDSELRNNFNKYLSPKEREYYIPEKFNNYNFCNNLRSLTQAAKDYEVPQIELCEEVNYTK